MRIKEIYMVNTSRDRYFVSIDKLRLAVKSIYIEAEYERLTKQALFI